MIWLATGQFGRLLLKVFTVLAAVFLLAIEPATAQVEVYDFYPETKYGGRSVAVSVNPSDASIAIEAAEGGGLYMTNDGGLNWSRVWSFPMFRMEDVSYDPNDPNIIFATTFFDGRSTTQSGIWRSLNGGTSWSRTTASMTCTANQTYRRIGIASGADVHQKIFVANECGVAYSNDSGDTWTNTDLVTGGNLHVFWDVAARRTGPDTVTAYACGAGGLYRTTVTGSAAPSWELIHGLGWFDGNNPPDPSLYYPVDNLVFPCGLAISPFDANVVFLAALNCPSSGGCGEDEYKHRLFEYHVDGSGFTSTRLPGPDSPGRPTWLATRPIPSTQDFDLIWGNGIATHWQRCRHDGVLATLDCVVAPDPDCSNNVDDDGDGQINEGCPPVGNPENEIDSPSECKNNADDDGDGAVNDGCAVMERLDSGAHGDPSGIDFDPVSGCPILAANDGGISRSTDCGVTWADRNDGRRALQIYNTFGTMRGLGPTDTDLYFGTQDNSWFASYDGGGWGLHGCCEGYGGQVDRRTPPGGASAIRMVYQSGAWFDHYNYSPRGFANFDGRIPFPPAGFVAPGGWAKWPPTMFGHQRWGLISHNQGCPPIFRLYIMQPEFGTQCDNDTDDDFDGAVNDGCPREGFFEEFGADCHDNVDNDGDGVVNDGCSHIYSAEIGSECANNVDDDGDGVVNDGCQAVGDAELLESDCANNVLSQCVNASDDDGDGAVNDGCPEAGVWGPMGPTFGYDWLQGMAAAGPASSPTFYFGVETASRVYKLRKIFGPFNSSATLADASGSGAETLDRIERYWGAPGTWESPLVFGVDPSNPNRLIAADHGTRQMKASSDGGVTWQVDTELTDLVVNSGEFHWDGTHGSQAWNIDFDPDDGQRILIGTEQAGIIATVDDGGKWFRLKDTLNRVPFVNSFFFDNDHDVIYASSYGSGLWTIEITNIPPVALCQDVTVPTEPGVCYADASIDAGSYDPDGGPVTLEQDPPGPYPLGVTDVTLTVTDDYGYTDTCTGTVTVVDLEPPQIDCAAPPTIIPPDAPISFTPIVTDNCAVAESAIEGYDCFMIAGNGKVIDKKDSCVVEFTDETITILDSGGVGDHITWTVSATDTSGNSTTEACEVLVVNPGKKP